MPKTILPIGNGYYESSSLPIAAQECVNWYVNVPQAPALNQETLFGTEGLVLENFGLGDDPANKARGAWTFEGVPFFVQGNFLYRLLPSGLGQNLGNIEGSGRVWIADNGIQMMVLVPEGKGYIYTNSGGLVEITDVDFTANGNPTGLVFIDGYFCCTTNLKKFIISSLNDGTSWNALDFGTAESSPDPAVIPFVFKNQLFIAGNTTVEGFSNIGGADFPFQRNGLFLDEGVAAPFSAVNSHNTFMFIGGQDNEAPSVWSFIGNNLQKISTTAIDNLLAEVTDAEMQQVWGWDYAQRGAIFVGWTLPTTTIVFDLITEKWHERKSLITELDGTTTFSRWRVESLTKAYNKILVGDSRDGRVGSLDIDTYTEYGNTIFRRVSTQPFQNTMKALFVPELELTMEAGVGNEDVPNPQVRMDRSVDGKTWGDDRTRRIGKIGDYKRRTIWRRLGRAARFEIFRFTLTDAVKPVIIQLTANLEGGAH